MPEDPVPSFRPHLSPGQKQWGAIITAVAGAIAAVVALVREPEEKAARQFEETTRHSYEVLSAQLEQMSASQRAMQEDLRRNTEWLARMRGYLQGLQGESLEGGDRSVAEAARRSFRRLPPPPPTAVRILPPPPEPTAEPPRARLPSFEEIREQAK